MTEPTSGRSDTPDSDSVEDAMKRALDLDPPETPVAPVTPSPAVARSADVPLRPSFGLPRAEPMPEPVPAPPPILRDEDVVIPPTPPQPPAAPEPPARVAEPARARNEPASRPESREVRAGWSTPPAERIEPPRPFPRSAALPMVNKVYDHLVEAPDDVIGFIAYALYKQDKRDWIIAWQGRHGVEPTEDQVEAFVNAQMAASQRERYRSAGRQILDSYALVAVDSERALITRDAVAGRVELAATRVEEGAARSRRWWRQLGLVLIGGIIAGAVVVGIVAVLAAAGIDVASYLGFEQTVAPDVVP